METTARLALFVALMGAFIGMSGSDRQPTPTTTQAETSTQPSASDQQPAQMAPTPEGWVELGWREVMSPPYADQVNFWCRFADYRGWEGKGEPPPSVDEALVNKFDWTTFEAAPLGFTTPVCLSAGMVLEAFVVYDPREYTDYRPKHEIFKVKAVRTKTP